MKFPWFNDEQYNWYQKLSFYRMHRKGFQSTFPGISISLRSLMHLKIRFNYINSESERMFSFRNKYKDSRCFILGNGPSLAQHDLNLLKNEFTIGSNGILNNKTPSSFIPSFTVLEDSKAALHFCTAFQSDEQSVKFISRNNSYLFHKSDTIYFFNPLYFENEKDWTENVRFSFDFNEYVYVGYTVNYIALQLAFYLGFKTVYLLGVDHTYGKEFDQKHLNNQGKSIQITAEDLLLLKNSHFNSQYSNLKIGSSFNIPSWDKQRENYQMADVVFKRSERTIINCTPQSALDIFPYQSFESIFSKVSK